MENEIKTIGIIGGMSWESSIEYIIKEIHIHRIAAFNALLMTLEEPPSHVMFIFATTEPRKIPITILSRCQRHDFRRIDVESISKHTECTSAADSPRW